MNEASVHYIEDKEWTSLLTSEAFDVLVKPVKNDSGKILPKTDVIVRIHHILVELDDGTTVNVPCKFDAYQRRLEVSINEIMVNNGTMKKQYATRNRKKEEWTIGNRDSFSIVCGHHENHTCIRVKKSKHDMFKIQDWCFKIQDWRSGYIPNIKYTIGYIPINGCNFVYIEKFIPIAEKRAGRMNKLMIKRIDEGHTCEFHVLANLEENNKKSLIETFVDAFLTKPEPSSI